MPPMKFDAAVTLAVPSDLMTAGLPEIVADAPLSGGVKVTKPPATGSFWLLAETVATSGAGNAPLANWPLPELTAMVNPRDSKAPMSGAEPWGRGMPRWSVVTPG